MLPITPSAAPLPVDDTIDESATHQCGRCRRSFPDEPDDHAGAPGDWWVCAPCREAILPSRVHALVLVSKLHKPAMRAIAYARATRPSVLEALTVEVDPEETAALGREWIARDVPVTLKIVASPYREITRPIIDYVKSLRTDNPRDVVIVYVPEYVVGHWW